MAEPKSSQFEVALANQASGWASPEAAAIQQELAEATAKRTANLAEDVAELMVEGWPKVEQFFSGKLPGVSDDALKSLLAKSYEIQLRDGEAAAAKAFRDGLGVGKVSRAHIDALMRDINLVSDNSLSKSATKALQLAANDPSKFTANLTDEIAVLAGESNTKRRATNFQKVMSIGETKKSSATLMDALRGKMKQGYQLQPSAHPIVAKAKNLLDKSPEALKANEFVNTLISGGHLAPNPEIGELFNMAQSGPAGAASTLSPNKGNPVVDVLRGKLNEGYRIPKRNVPAIRDLVRLGKTTPGIINSDAVATGLLQQRLIEESPERLKFARILSGRPESISLNDRIIGSNVNNAFVPLSDVSISAKPKPKLAAPTTLLSKLKGFAKARPVLTGLAGGAALDVGLEAALLGSKVLNRWAEAPMREAQRRAEPSTREMIENIYLQRRFQRNRAIEMQANPHLAAYEKHQADLAAGQVPGMVTF